MFYHGLLDRGVLACMIYLVSHYRSTSQLMLMPPAADLRLYGCLSVYLSIDLKSYLTEPPNYAPHPLFSFWCVQKIYLTNILQNVFMIFHTTLFVQLYSYCTNCTPLSLFDCIIRPISIIRTSIEPLKVVNVDFHYLHDDIHYLYIWSRKLCWL